MPLLRARPARAGYTPIVSPADSDLRYLSFGLVTLGNGESWRQRPSEQETVLVVLGGKCDVAAGGQRWERIGERVDVFGGKPTAVYVPPGCEFEVTGRGKVEVAVCGAQAESGPAATLIPPERVGFRKVGEGAFHREIHDLVTAESFPAKRLIVGETYNPPGLWSSYPAHKHDRAEPPQESALEEVYHFRVQPPQGFGLQRVYGEGLPGPSGPRGDPSGSQRGQGFDEAYAVQDRDTAVITRGYHPVVAAPGYRLYYLWMLAGERRIMQWREDPAHAWVRDTR